MTSKPPPTPPPPPLQLAEIEVPDSGLILTRNDEQFLLAPVRQMALADDLQYYFACDEMTDPHADEIGGDDLEFTNMLPAATIAIPSSAYPHARALSVSRASSDYFETPDDGSRDVSGDFTVCYWFNPQGAASSNFEVIAAKGTANGTANTKTWSTYLTNAAAGTTLRLQQGSGSSNVSTDVTITREAWNFVALGKSGSDFFWFVNGTYGSKAGVTTYNSTDDITVGAFGDGSFDSTCYFGGLAQWERALSVPDLRYIYNEGGTGRDYDDINAFNPVPVRYHSQQRV